MEFNHSHPVSQRWISLQPWEWSRCLWPVSGKGISSAAVRWEGLLQLLSLLGIFTYTSMILISWKWDSKELLLILQIKHLVTLDILDISQYPGPYAESWFKKSLLFWRTSLTNKGEEGKGGPKCLTRLALLPGSFCPLSTEPRVLRRAHSGSPATAFNYSHTAIFMISSGQVCSCFWMP